MIRTGETLENPVTGERLTFHRTSKDTGGESVLFETASALGAFRVGGTSASRASSETPPPPALGATPPIGFCDPLGLAVIYSSGESTASGAGSTRAARLSSCSPLPSESGRRLALAMQKGEGSSPFIRSHESRYRRLSHSLWLRPLAFKTGGVGHRVCLGAPAVIGEAALEQSEGVFASCADLGGEGGAARPGQRSPASEIDQRAMEGHHRLCGDTRRDVVGGRFCFLREQRRQCIGVLGDDLSLPGPQRRARGRESRQFGHPTPAVARRGTVGAVEDEADEGAQRGLPLGPLPHRGQELLLERVHPLVHEILFGRKVVEDGRLGDIGSTGDLGDADLIEATLEKEAHRGVSDRLAGLLFLSLSKA
jgi:hypothetical protein